MIRQRLIIRPSWPRCSFCSAYLAGLSFLLFLIYLRKPAANNIACTLLDSEYDYKHHPVADHDFGGKGLRARELIEWTKLSELVDFCRRSAAEKQKYERIVENLVIEHFPFVCNSTNLSDPTPFNTLRRSYRPGSKGIVIPAGNVNIRFAAQLITALRDLHKVTLPIAIAYAGDRDLSPGNRKMLLDLYPELEMLDIISILDDTIMHLADLDAGTAWAIKPFAILASPFEQVLLADADTVFVRTPELVFESGQSAGYESTGALFFRERNLLHGEEDHSDRRQFLREQIKSMNSSSRRLDAVLSDPIWTDLQDSGVVVLNKRVTSVLVGLLHTCWQNSQPVRDIVTYNTFYGDKETFWLGMEFTGADYAIETRPGGMLGVLVENVTFADQDAGTHLCGNTIVHETEDGEIWWYNGSLLRHKTHSLIVFLVPTHYQAEGDVFFWGDSIFPFCSSGGGVFEVGGRDREVLQASVEKAKILDGKLGYGGET